MSDTSTNTGRYQATFAKLKAEGRGALSHSSPFGDPSLSYR